MVRLPTRSIRRRILASVLVGFVGPLAFMGLAVSADEGSPTFGHPMIGTDAPSFELKAAGGDMLSLQDLRGQYVVIHFGASW